MRGVSLSLRIVLLVVITSGVLTLGMLVTVYQLMVNDYEALVAERESAEIERLAFALEVSLEQRLIALEALSSRLVAEDNELLDSRTLLRILVRPSTASDVFPDGLLIMNAAGTAIAESVYVQGRLGTNYADREHFQRAFATRSGAISAPLLGRATGLPLLGFVQPILSFNGDILGYVGGVLDLSDGPLLDAEYTPGTHSNIMTLIVDPQYRMFVSMNERIDTPRPLPAAGTDPMVDAAVAVQPSGTLIDYQGQQFLIASRQLETLGWVVLRAIPYHEAISPASRSFRRFLLISLISLVVVALAGWWVARSITRPIDRITRRIDRMADDARLDSNFAEQGSPEVRALARAMNKLVRERKAVEQLKDGFISSVSHELRTPLTSLHGSLTLLHAGVTEGVPQRAKGLVALSLRNSERLLTLVNDLLDFSRLMSGRVELHPVPCSISVLAEHATADIAPFAQKSGVRFKLDIPADATVLADEQRLRQVVDNLLSNAIKHSPDNGTVWLTARVTDAGRWRLTISDQGSGVPDAFAPRIFQRFAQADHGNRREATGTGLGLAISKGLTEQMNGDIGFYNDEGAHFWVDLPADDRDSSSVIDQ